MAKTTVAAANVLALVSSAVQAVPGVARLGQGLHSDIPGALVGRGVVVHPTEGGLVVECYVSAAANVFLPDLGLAVQATVAAVLRDIAGRAVQAVHVSILDVEASRG